MNLFEEFQGIVFNLKIIINQAILNKQRLKHDTLVSVKKINFEVTEENFFSPYLFLDQSLINYIFFFF